MVLNPRDLQFNPRPDFLIYGLLNRAQFPANYRGQTGESSFKCIAGMHNLFAIAGRIKFIFVNELRPPVSSRYFCFLHCFCSACVHWA